MYERPITADDRRWRAESDARALAESTKIQKDPARMKAAVEAAKRMAEEQRDDAAAMSNVAKRSSGSNALKRKVKPVAKQGDLGKKDVEKAVKFNVFQKI